MPSSLPDDVRRMLLSPNPAVMATLAKDGRPISAATWYLLEDDDTVLIDLDEKRVRLGHLHRDPRFALTVLDGGDWYRHVSLQLRATSITADTGLASIDRLSEHYSHQPYPERSRPRVAIRAEILAWQRWAASGD